MHQDQKMKEVATCNHKNYFSKLLEVFLFFLTLTYFESTFFEKGSINLRLQFVLETKESQNYLAQILEPTPFSIEMDVDITILFATSSPHVCLSLFLQIQMSLLPLLKKNLDLKQ